MIQIKKTILTLVALLAVTTGAWATDAYEEFTTTASWTSYDQTADHFRVTGSYGFPQGLSIGTTHNYSITIAALNSETISKVEMTIGDMGTWNDGDVISSTAGSVSGSYAVNGTITVDNPNASTVTLSAGERYLIIKAVKVYYTEGSSASAVEVDWNKTSKTGTFTMLGGNVELEPEYYPQAVLTAKPTAINDVPATTDGAIVNAGTVANIGETTTAQGTVMYYVSTTALDDAALLALAADAWTADVPTAESFTAAGTAYVYYYVRGNDSDTDDEIFSDGDILSTNALTVTIAAAPTYAVTFADDTAEPTEWTASPNTNVTKGETVTVTYTGSKKVIGVKAEKKSAAPATVLSGALVDGATIKVNFKWRGGNSGDYVQGVYNAASGTFTVSKGGGYWGTDDRAVYKVEKSGDNIIIGASITNFSNNEAMVWTFNTTNDTYTTTNGTMVNAHPDWYGLISVTLNGTDITSQLTAQ